MVPVGEVDESGWVVAGPARVTRLGEVVSGRVDRDGALTELVAELAKSRTGYSNRRGVVREVVVGRGVPVSVGEADPDGVGFIMVVFVAWAGRRGAAAGPGGVGADVCRGDAGVGAASDADRDWGQPVERSGTLDLSTAE